MPSKPEAVLKLEAAKQLATRNGGSFESITVEHVCGTAKQMGVVFWSAGEKFDARLRDGVIQSLAVLVVSVPKKKAKKK